LGETDSPDLFIIAESPNSEEHYDGTAFSGRPNKMLLKVIDELEKKLDRKITVYGTYAASCRHFSDRPPTQHELSCCNNRLVSEIQAIKPKAILILGLNSASFLTDTKSISSARNKVHLFQNISTVITYSPSFVFAKGNSTSFQSFVDDIVLAVEAPLERKYDWGKRKYTVIDNEEDCIKLFNLIGTDGEKCSLDIENTSGFNPYAAFILYVGIKHSSGTYIIPNNIFKAYKDYFNPNTNVIVHRAAHEYKFFAVHYDIWLTNIDDTLSMFHQCDERTNVYADKDLKSLGKLLVEAPDWDTDIHKYIDKMEQAPKDMLYEYLAYDVDVTYELEPVIRNMLDKDGTLDAYNKVIRPSIPFLNKMSNHGIRIDLDYVEVVDKELTEDLEDIVEQFTKCVGKEINIGSPKQLVTLLYDEMGYPFGSSKSTNEKTLVELATQFPEDTRVIDLILAYRSTSKLLSTYVKGIYGHEKNGKWVDGLCRPDGRIHAEFKLEGTSTGRLSAELVQTIPSRKGPLIKKMFLPDEGMDLIELDYKQLELRMGAHMSGDAVLTEYINSGNDMHTDMARLIFGIHNITKDQRFVAKSGNFGVMYRMDERAAFYNLKKEFPAMTMTLAKKIVDMPRDKFRQLFFWSTGMLAKAMEDHYTTTIFGRKRRFPLIHEGNFEDVLKQMSNAGIQGSSSDVNLLGAGRCDKELPINSHLLVHDSYVASIPKGFDPKEIAQRMEDVPFETKVKFEVEYKVMDRWGG
jgi:uracil-DNA glycosylase family 4